MKKNKRCQKKSKAHDKNAKFTLKPANFKSYELHDLSIQNFRS